jgi:hypothetical protein
MFDKGEVGPIVGDVSESHKAHPQGDGRDHNSLGGPDDDHVLSGIDEYATCPPEEMMATRIL